MSKDIAKLIGEYTHQELSPKEYYTKCNNDYKFCLNNNLKYAINEVMFSEHVHRKLKDTQIRIDKYIHINRQNSPDRDQPPFVDINKAGPDIRDNFTAYSQHYPNDIFVASNYVQEVIDYAQSIGLHLFAMVTHWNHLDIKVYATFKGWDE